MLAGLEFIEEEFIEPMAESDVSDGEDIGSVEVRPESESESEAVFRRAAFMPSGITQVFQKYVHSRHDKPKKRKHDQ